MHEPSRDIVEKENLNEPQTKTDRTIMANIKDIVDSLDPMDSCDVRCVSTNNGDVIIITSGSRILSREDGERIHDVFKRAFPRHKVIILGMDIRWSLVKDADWMEVRDDNLPALGEIVWLREGERIWIGGRADDSEGWLWGNTYGNQWHNGVKWDGDLDTDDDYTPTHWMRLPSWKVGDWCFFDFRLAMVKEVADDGRVTGIEDGFCVIESADLRNRMFSMDLRGKRISDIYQGQYDKLQEFRPNKDLYECRRWFVEKWCACMELRHDAEVIKAAYKELKQYILSEL